MPVHDRYLARLATDRFEPDEAQQAALREFADLHRRLIETLPPGPARPGGLRGFLRRARVRAPQALRGLYLWGGVGRGKTHLADLFFDELPFEGKLRMHFHQFMRQVRERLDEARKLARSSRNHLASVNADLAEVRCTPNAPGSAMSVTRSIWLPAISPPARDCCAWTKCRSPTLPTPC